MSVGGINVVSTSASGERSSGSNIPRVLSRARGGKDECISRGPLGRALGGDRGGLDALLAALDEPDCPLELEVRT